MANILDYMDYRKFLGDSYRENKARNPRHSYRYIAAKVGFRSASFFSHILSGRTNISPAMAGRFAAYLKLKRKEADYFEALVNYNQAKDAPERKRCLERLLTFRGTKVRLVQTDHYEFYDKWFYAAIRERLYFQPFKGDFEELAASLAPPIKASEARQAIALLGRLGMIRKDAQGRMVRADAVSDSTGAQARALAIDNFHRQTLALAAEAIRRFPRERRSISTLTFSLSPKGYRVLEEELAAFRRRLAKIAEEDSREDTVYHVNFNVFPLTSPPGEETP